MMTWKESTVNDSDETVNLMRGDDSEGDTTLQIRVRELQYKLNEQN
jgi:hypothetical protein